MGRYDGFDDFVAARRVALSRTAFFLAAGVRADAEDLLQEALTRTAERWPRVRTQGDAAGYVKQIMLNQVRSRWRRSRVLTEEPVAEVPERTATSQGDAGDLSRALLAALKGLSPGQRSVLYLRYYEDQTEAETARLLGCSVGTVKSQAHAALRRLRDLAPELTDSHDSEVKE